MGLDIAHDGKSMLNCDLITDPQTTFLFYTFPEAGNYTLKVAFFDKQRQLADPHRFRFRFQHLPARCEPCTLPPCC